jgi:hypothetical protein
MTEMAVRPEKCVHYWIIESPHGPTSKGRCRYCGTEAEFFNDLQGCLNNGKSYNAGVYSERAMIRGGNGTIIDIS